LFKREINRTVLLGAMYISLLLILSIKLVFLQVYPTQEVKSQYKNQQSELITNSKFMILDTNNRDMMKYNKKYILVIDKKPFSLNNYEKSIENLMVLNLIMKQEDQSFNYTDIMKSEGKTYFQVSEDTYNKINKLIGIKGIYTYIRDEVKQNEAWEISNYISRINFNKSFDEGTMNSTVQNIIKDNQLPRKDFYLNTDSEYQNNSITNILNNKNIKLTIDSELEENIRQVMAKEDYSKLKNIGVIIMESDTGKVRAIVQKDESQANINLAIEGSGYEPGSVYKLITLGAALDKGLYSMNSSFCCTGKVCSASHIHGKITLQEALTKSCNDTFATVGRKVGYDTLMNYSEQLGLFKKILNLQEESRGLKPESSDGMDNISIGQCITVSPIQMIGAANSIVNGGVYVKPYILEGVLDSNDKVIQDFGSESKKVFSKTTAKIIKNAMLDVVNKGTGINARIKGIDIGGKTGSATSGTGETIHGWFIGYFTANNKTYTMCVFIPNIEKEGENGEELGGGNTAAPIFREIVDNIINNKQ
jgi:cell division protein FtsI/penicillin-binding protein 2